MSKSFDSCKAVAQDVSRSNFADPDKAAGSMEYRSDKE